MTRKLTGTEVKRLHRSWRRVAEGRLALLLDGVQTPYNVGSIIRTAAAFSVERLYLTRTTALPTSAGSRKTSIGTERYLSWTVHPDGRSAVEAARQDGFAVVGVELTEGALPLHEPEIPGDVCLALGHEDHGLSASCLGELDRVLYIPQTGRVGSLNVATAAAIALYELRRRSWAV